MTKAMIWVGKANQTDHPNHGFCRTHVSPSIDPKTAQFYPSQTKILEGQTNFSECVFEVLFKGVSTLFGLRIVLRKPIRRYWSGLPQSSFGEPAFPHSSFERGIHHPPWERRCNGMANKKMRNFAPTT